MPTSSTPPGASGSGGGSRDPWRSESTGDAWAAGMRVGAYTLRQPIGRGGFGEVWLADRESPRRRVALKLIRGDRVDREIVARFELERQALAMLAHPGIAQIYETGVTPNGLPWFAMEFVDGKRLLSFCDDDRRDLRERLEIFARICDAVHFAHQQGLIHRDLSPDNILVAIDAEGRPQPKVIDFGVAKAVNSAARIGDATIVTQWRTIVGKPEYMSPEQAEGGSIDTRSDLYTLGVILYELLAGTLPIRTESFRNASIADAIAQIRTAERPTPLTRFRELDPASRAGAALARGSLHERALATELRGRIRHLPMKALRSDRSKRYSSAAAFARDVRNYLEGRDFIEAASEPWRERLARRVSRHRVVFAAAALLMLAIIGGLVGTTLGYRAAVEARDRAEASALREREARREADDARVAAERRFEQARAFASRMLLEFVPMVQDVAGATPPLDFLAQAALEHLRGLEIDAGDRPELRRDIAVGYIRAGDVLMRRGNIEGSEEAVREALTLVEHDPAAEARRISSMAHERLGRAASVRRDFNASIERYERSRRIRSELADSQTATPEDVRAVVIAIQGIGDALDAQGRLPEALARYEEAIERLRPRGADAAPRMRQDLALTLMRSASTLQRSRRPDEALLRLQEARPLLEAALEAEPANIQVQRDLAVLLSMLCERLVERGSAADASEAIERAVAIFERLADADPTNARAARDAAIAQNSLGSAAESRGDIPRAIAAFRRHAERMERLARREGADARAKLDLVAALREFGRAQIDAGDTAGGLATLQLSVQEGRSLLDERPDDMQAARESALSMQLIARALVSAGRFDEALHQLEAAEPLCERVVAAQPERARARRELARVHQIRANALAELGEPVRALESLQPALALYEALAAQDPTSVPAQRDLAAVQEQRATLEREARSSNTDAPPRP